MSGSDNDSNNAIALTKKFSGESQQVWDAFFYKLLRSNGYSSIHYDKGRLAKAIQTNFTFSRPLLEGVHKYIGYTDMELCGEFYAY